MLNVDSKKKGAAVTAPLFFPFHHSVVPNRLSGEEPRCLLTMPKKIKNPPAAGKRKIAPAEKPPHPDITEQQAAAESRRLVINAVPEITRAIIEQAEAGHYLHARMLFDLVGFAVAAPAAQQSAIAPIVELLMREMDFPVPASAPS